VDILRENSNKKTIGVCQDKNQKGAIAYREKRDTVTMYKRKAVYLYEIMKIKQQKNKKEADVVNTLERKKGSRQEWGALRY
jgi:hypothetical protein